MEAIVNPMASTRRVEVGDITMDMTGWAALLNRPRQRLPSNQGLTTLRLRIITVSI